MAAKHIPQNNYVHSRKAHPNNAYRNSDGLRKSESSGGYGWSDQDMYPCLADDPRKPRADHTACTAQR